MAVVLREHLVRDPWIGQRLVFERIAVVHRRAVGRVRVPVMHVQHPVVVRAVPIQPVEGEGVHPIRRFAAAGADVQALVQPRVEPPRRMAFREGRYGRGVHPGVTELRKEGVFAVEVGEMAVDPLRTEICRCPAMTDDTGADAVLSGHKRRAGWQAGRVRAVVPIEADPLRRHGIHIRRGISAVPVAAHMVGAQGVNVKDNDAHGMPPFGCMGRAASIVFAPMGFV